MKRLKLTNVPKMTKRLDPDKIILCTDLDEVVFPYIETLRGAMIEAGMTPPEGEVASWSMSESGWFGSTEEFKEFHGGEVDRGFYAKLIPYEDASSVLNDLVHSGYWNSILTSRFVNPGQHRKVVSQTVEALDEGRIPYSALSFMDNKTLTLADAYIEDAPHNLIALHEAGRFIIRKEMKYNEGCPGIPVKNMTEAREVLRDRFGQ